MTREPELEEIRRRRELALALGGEDFTIRGGSEGSAKTHLVKGTH